MPLPYRLIKNTNTKSPFVNQFYAKAEQMGTMDINAIADEIQSNCSLKRSDVVACISEFIDVFKRNLQMGVCMHLNGLGRFRMGIKGSYAKTEKAFSVANNIKRCHVNFMPDGKIVKGTTVITNDDGTTYIKKTRTRVNYICDGVSYAKVVDKKTA